MTTITSEPNVDDHDTYRIALYYCYVPLDDNDIDTIYNFHIKEEYNHHNNKSTLGGRIRIASEGLNGVLSGTYIDLQHYEHDLRTLLCTITSSKDENISNLHDNHMTPAIDDNNNNNNNNDSVQWELDMKYCKLRTDLTVQSQLFPKWQIQKTDTVIGLIERTSSSSGNVDIDETSSSLLQPTLPKRNRRRQQQQQNEDDEQQKNLQQQQQLDMIRDIYNKSITNKVCKKQLVSSAPHLSPIEWNRKLEQLVQQQQSGPSTSKESSRTNIVLLDCRNCYESAVGYFEVPGVTTILTNTRKYSELPTVLINEILNNTTTLHNATHIFMYCTGGVRCERASTFLQSAIESIIVGNSTTNISSIVSSDTENDNVENCIVPTTSTKSKLITTKKQLPEIYQLHGGIQRYLEQYSNDTQHNNDDNNIQSSLSNYYYKGKNFVFDLRRTDPIVITKTTTPSKTLIKNDNDTNAIPKIITTNTTTNSVVGQCLVCTIPYDDYDNGYAPYNNKETRCYKCRILILVCNHCRTNVLCWGDTKINNKQNDDNDNHCNKNDTSTKSNAMDDITTQNKRKLYCGGLEPLECLYMPSVKIINGI